MSIDRDLVALGRAFGFTAEELECNLRGVLHAAQQARGRRQGWVGVVVLCVLGILALVGGVLGGWAFSDAPRSQLSAVDRNALLAIHAAAVLVACIFFLSAVVSVLRRRARAAAFAAGRLEVLEGPLHKIHIQGRGVPDRHCFRVGPRTFEIARAPWELLTQGAVYRAHLVADRLLSIAPVFEDAVERATFDAESAHFERTREVSPSRWVQRG